MLLSRLSPLALGCLPFHPTPHQIPSLRQQPSIAKEASACRDLDLLWPALTSSALQWPHLSASPVTWGQPGANSCPQPGAQRRGAQIKDSATSYLPVCFTLDLAPVLLYYYKAYNYSILSAILLTIAIMINNIISLLVLWHMIITNISILTTVTMVCVTMHRAFHFFYHLCDSGTFITIVATAANHSDEEEIFELFMCFRHLLNMKILVSSPNNSGTESFASANNPLLFFFNQYG